MADEVPAFDPTMKKKKKKVTAEFDGGDESAAAAAVEAVSEKVEDLALGDLDFGKKKKKKKKTEEGGEGEAGAEEPPAEEATDDMGDLAKLKKKKKKKTRELGDDDLGDGGDEGEEAATATGSGLPWDGTTRDYHYDELLGRVFGILRENNPDLAGEKHKTILKPPQVLREGTKKTVFVNFSELCKAMHRTPEHVINFLMAELGTSGSLDGQARLVVKGRFLPKVFEGILRRYINEYVICNMCKSADTLLHKENRLYILRCQACGASRSVAAIKAGFLAQVGRRKQAPS